MSPGVMLTNRIRCRVAAGHVNCGPRSPFRSTVPTADLASLVTTASVASGGVSAPPIAAIPAAPRFRAKRIAVIAFTTGAVVAALALLLGPARRPAEDVTRTAVVPDSLVLRRFVGSGLFAASQLRARPTRLEAIDLVQKKRDSDGRWPLENPHAGEVHFDLEVGVGKPSRWNTLRALRVLDWYSGRE